MSDSITQKTFRYLWRFYSLIFRGFLVAFPWLFRAGREQHSKASPIATGLLVYTCCHHVGVSPGEDTDSEWGLAPKKKSSEDCGLADKDLVLEVSSEDWVEGDWSQLGLARWGGSSMSSLTGYVLLGGLATVGLGRHSANDCHAALSRMHDSGAHSSELAWRLAVEYAQVPCLTRVCVRWCSSLWKSACAPGGSPAMLFQDYWYHALFESVDVKPLLAVSSAFDVFFSEKVTSDWLFDVRSVDSHIDPDF